MTDGEDAAERRAADAAAAPLSLQQKLAEAEQRLHIAQAVARAAGAWEWDVASNILIADVRFANLYGLDPAAAASGLPASDFFAAVHPEDRLRLKIAVTGALHGAEVFARDYRVIPEDGVVHWVSARGRTYLDENDRPVRFSGVLTDITEQKRLEERLRVAQTAGGVGSFEYLSGYGTVDVSEQFCRLLGLHPATSLPVRTINGLVHPDDRRIIQDRDGQAAGAAFHEFRIRRADTGEERWLVSRGEYRTDGSDGVSFIGVIYDITSTKRSEEQLRMLADTLEARVAARTEERDRVWKLSRDLLNVIGRDGEYRAVNPAWKTVLGYDEAEVVGVAVGSFVHPDDAEAARAHLERLKQGQTVSDFDCRMCAKDGAYRWVNWTAMPEGDAIYGIGRDITQRKLLEDQLRQSQKMEAVGQLTGGLAHDFNNMLTGILGGIDMVRRRLAEGRYGEVDRFLDAVTQSGQRAAALTHRLLAFSRRQSLDSRPLDVGTLAASMVDLLQRTLGEQVSLAIDMAPDLWPAVADDNQLESAILNLAINARDAMPAGGKLIIAGRNRHLTSQDLVDSDRALAGDYVEISVTDTGEGMSAEVLAKAFDPFYTTKPLGQGTGLGLSMIYGFIQQSQGHVLIDSVVGQGTTIRLFLPRLAGAVDEEGAISGQGAAAPTGAGETVLVIEDDPAVRLLVMQVLEELGYKAIETADGSQAVPILQSGRHLDLLISDVGLPGLNGRQLAEIARLSRPNLPILFMTGYAKQAADQADFLDGGMEIIAKPFDIEHFGRRIGEILGRRTA